MYIFQNLFLYLEKSRIHSQMLTVVLPGVVG